MVRFMVYSVQMNSLLNSAISILTAASIAVFPYHAVRGDVADPPTSDDIDQRITELRRKAEGLRGEIRRERFDPDARVDSEQYDLDELIEFVRDEVVFQPYAGTLRGAAGTLRAGAGSSLDQALLLAQMVRSAGFDARIVRGELDEDTARRLLDTSANAPASGPLEYMDEAIRKHLGASGPEDTASQPLSESSFYVDTQRHAGLLLRALDEAGIALQPSDATERLLETTRTYFWVETRDGPSDPWRQAHPAFGDAEPPATLQALETLTDTVPDDYHHRFTLSAWIEQWLGGKIERHRVMKPWSAPVANLNNVPIRFQNVPNGITRENSGNLDQVLAATSVLMPFFGDAAASGGMAFDLQGRAIDPMAQGGSPAAGIIKTVGDKMVDATGGLADREDGKPAMALHSMYLEFTFHRPDGSSETRRRYVLPPRDHYEESDSEVLRQLITGHTYMVATGGQPRDYIVDQFIEGTIGDIDWLKYVVQAQETPDDPPELPDHLLSAFPTLYQQWSMERLPVADDVVRFRAQPALVGIRDGFRDARTAFSEVDVVWNAVEALQRNQDGWSTAPRTALTAGVWDTVLEALPLSNASSAQSTSASTPLVFDMADEEGIGLVVLRPDQPAETALAALSLDTQEARFVRRDLEAGYTIVIPEQTPDRALMAGWWRVRAENGETLGMLGDGYGATATEYIVVLTVVALGLATAMRASTEYYDCDEGDMKTKLCCALEKHLGLAGDEAEGEDVIEPSGEEMHEMLCGD